MILEAKNLVTYYGKAQALRDVSLSVGEGQIVTLLGANGAGKTTTLMTISGVIRPKSGSVTYQGRDITNLRPASIVNLGLAHCPEGRALFPDMSVADNLEMGAYLQKGKQEIQAQLEHVYQRFPRLAERRKQMAGSLSGGEQQMLAIGRALMSRPQLLMLDEPSLGLSPLLVEQMFEIILDIRKEGTSVLLVEQNVAAALEVADYGFVLETGRMVFSGSQKELMGNDQIRSAYLGK
ncbi:MAG: ABC transporter ATP-binding protein [Deltaproteobacteria bacterium]|nr:ABC transporter ATP-binding protein [Deltaproteobacteria bacterium]